MSTFWRDLRYASRVLLKTPVTTAIAIISLTLGIGANTAVFGILNALFLRSLPVRDARELVSISTISPDRENDKDPLSVPMLLQLSRRQQVFSSLFGWNGGGMNNFEANGLKYAASLDTVSGDYFSTLGVRPLLGRLIQPEDVAAEIGLSARVAVLGYHCWQTRYHGDPGIVGKVIRVDGIPFTIIGVTPKSFTGLMVDTAPEATVPIGYSWRESFRGPGNLWLSVVGRLKPGVTLPQAGAAIRALWPAIQAATVPPEYTGSQRDRFFARGIEVESAATGNSFMRERLSGPITVVMGLVAMVLLIACVNLANLMLARVTDRAHEFGIRTALGAGRWQTLQQVLIESVTLSMAGAALGVLTSFWTTRFLVKMIWFGYVDLTLDPTPDVRVLGFTAALAITTGVLFGLPPAWRATQAHPASALQRNQRAVRSGPGALGKFLVSAQISLSLVMVIGAMLFVGSLQKLISADRGFNRKNVLVMQLFPQAGREHIPDRTVYYHQLADALSRLAGVEAASYSHMGPVLSYEYKIPISVTGSSGEPVQAVQEIVGPGFFHLIGMHLVSGREFDWRDDERTSQVVVISESLARRLFPAGGAVGHRLDDHTDADYKGMQIVGVANSASLWTPRSQKPLAIYFALLQMPRYNQSKIVLRTSEDPKMIAAQARRTLESMGYHYALSTQTLEERTSLFLTDERMVAILSTFFGGLALLLAAVGVYGIMSFTVTQRTSEIGVRMALGARESDIAVLVVRQVVWLALLGLSFGISVALIASRYIASMLFGLAPTDPTPVAMSIAVLLSVAVLAGYLPARRAARMDPMTALRTE